MLELVVGSLATWCISTLIYAWKGLDGLRKAAGVYGPYKTTVNHAVEAEELVPVHFAGRLLDCYWCVCLVIGAVLTPVALLEWRVLMPFAMAGAAMLLSHGGRTVWRIGADG